MTQGQFFKLVADCRRAQRAYFASRTTSDLVVARAAEKSLDDAIAAIEQQRAQRADPQQDLFHNSALPAQKAG